MNEMKEFLDYRQTEYTIHFREELGLFFWERGGKQFVKLFGADEDLKKVLIPQAKWYLMKKQINDNEEVEHIYILLARDFLDALACLGEEKTKQLIEELK